ncbi:helix-turn-helix domain-containing protein [Planktotalea sp.]|uniref:GlxA family transcriptional regulator n=1 Tax=Planktotalea sp. TaxID=2029877 RepID=UPI0025EDE91F|nr:helix-turn-helix domain-containing protein [Planktotalea sp.]
MKMNGRQNANSPSGYQHSALTHFEIYVGRGFCEFETAAITQALKTANAVKGATLFHWRYVSETPGLLNGDCGMIVRAEPLVRDHELGDALIVVGGRSGQDGAWFARLRQMTRLSRTCVLLSNAATTYIKQTKTPAGKVTTHWHDALALMESGDHPTLTNALSEKSGSVMTSAGSGATMEIIIALIAPQMSRADVGELGNRLLLPLVRTAHADQPNDITELPALSDARVKAAVKAMDQSLDTPFNIYQLAQEIGVSTRHLERMFKEVFNQTPARFYKQLRTKRARALIEETQLPMMEIAIATGFGSSSSMNEAIKKEYGFTATKMRTRR